MAVYKALRPGGRRSSIYTMEFSLHGVKVRETTGCRLKADALKVEKKKRKELEAQLDGFGMSKKINYVKKRMKEIEESSNKIQAPELTPPESEVDDWLLEPLDKYGIKLNPSVNVSALSREIRARLEVVENRSLKLMTFSEGITRIHKERFSKNARPESTKKLLWIEWALENMMGRPTTYLHEINVDLVKDIQEVLLLENVSQKFDQGKKRSPRTIGMYSQALKTLLNAACQKWEVIERVPYVEVQKSGMREVVVPIDHLNVVIEKCNEIGSYEPRYMVLSDLLKVLYMTGMRVGECVSCNHGNYDFDNESIFLAAEQTKSSKPRVLPMPRQVKEILSKRVQDAPNNVWPINSNTVSRSLRHVMDKLQIMNTDSEYWTCHALRHTYATESLKNNTGIDDLCKLLGHADISTTMRYAHHSLETLRSAVSWVDDLNII